MPWRGEILSSDSGRLSRARTFSHDPLTRVAQGLRDMQGSGFGVPTGELAGDEPWLRSDAVSKTAAQILGMLPVEFDLAEVQKAYPLTRSESRNRVLIQELSLHNELSNVVRNTLHWLMSCLKGDERMDVAMEELAKQIYHGQVPAEWMKKSFPSEKPLMSFIRLLESASTFFQKWVRAGTPTAFWLPAFFFPQQVRFDHPCGVRIDLEAHVMRGSCRALGKIWPAM